MPCPLALYRQIVDCRLLTVRLRTGVWLAPCGSGRLGFVGFRADLVRRDGHGLAADFFGRTEFRANVAQHRLWSGRLPALHLAELSEEDAGDVVGDASSQQDQVAGAQLLHEKLSGACQVGEGVRVLGGHA